MTRSNIQRASAAAAALKAWKGAQTVDTESDLCDLLADLRHLCRLTRSRPAERADVLGPYTASRWDFDREVERSRVHYDAEKQAPDWYTEFVGRL